MQTQTREKRGDKATWDNSPRADANTTPIVGGVELPVPGTNIPLRSRTTETRVQVSIKKPAPKIGK